MKRAQRPSGALHVVKERGLPLEYGANTSFRGTLDVYGQFSTGDVAEMLSV